MLRWSYSELHYVRSREIAQRYNAFDQGVTGMTKGPVQFEVGKTIQAVSEAPVIQVDGAQLFVLTPEMVKFNLYQDRLTGEPTDPTLPPIQRVVCARLVMTPVIAKQLADWLQSNTSHIASGETQLTPETSQ
jgi:hypothetical protein